MLKCFGSQRGTRVLIRKKFILSRGIVQAFAIAKFPPFLREQLRYLLYRAWSMRVTWIAMIDRAECVHHTDVVSLRVRARRL